MNLITKPEPEVIGDYIHIRVEDPAKFVSTSFRTIDIDDAKGIKAVVGRYKSDDSGPTHTQKFLFNKEKWSVAEATTWVRDHKDVEPEINKFIDFEIKEQDEADRSFWAVASTSEVDRDGDILEVEGWKLKNFKKNPVILWAHQYHALPVAKAEDIKIEDGKLKFKPKFMPAEVNPFAENVYQAYKQGYLRAFSVGFIPLKAEEIEPDEDGETESRGAISRRGRRFKSQELLEISAVTVPSLPSALSQRGLQDVLTKGFSLPGPAQPAQSKEPEDAIWKASTEVGRSSINDLKIICAWQNPEEKESRISYKLPYRRQESKKAVWRAVSAAMGALLGARGGVNIPDADRKGVYDTLAKAYREFGKEPPEFRTYAEPELKRIFDDVWFEELGDIMNSEMEAKDARAQEAEAVKAGRVLSKKNRALVKQCADLLVDLYNATEPEPAPAQGEDGKEQDQIQTMTKSLDKLIAAISK